MPRGRFAALVFIAVTCIVIGDTAGKFLTARGVDPVFIAWTRFALAAIVLLPLSGMTRAELPLLARPSLILRTSFIVGGICCILTALQTEPLANVFGAFFIGPIVSYVLAVLFLGETPSRLRALLLGLGFAGVMLVVKPGFGATIGLGFALAAGTLYGAYLAMTRHVASAYRPRFLLISQLLIGALMLSPFGVATLPASLNLTIFALLLLSAMASAVGNYLLVRANRVGEASLIAPLVYTQLLSATVLGVTVFGDWPDLVALAGLVIIAGSGLGSLFLAQGPAVEKEIAPKA